MPDLSPRRRAEVPRRARPPYRGRLFRAADFRYEVLARLLALNAEQG